MNTLFPFPGRRLARLLMLVLAGYMSVSPVARAGLTVDIHLYHDELGYYFYSYLSADATLPAFPNGVYQIASPTVPIGGSQLIFYATNGTISECYNGNCGGGTYYGTFDSALNAITNGPWSITVTNNISTNVYYFPLTVSGLNSNVFGAPPMAVYPANGQTMIPKQPLLLWTAPTTNWEGTLYVEDNSVDTNGNANYVTGQNLAPGATSWTPGIVLPDGTNQFSVDYQSNVTALVIASQPTNTSGQPISGWTSTATLETHFYYPNNYNVTFTVGSGGQPVDDYGPFLVARYNFEDTNNPYNDSSGNNNNPDCGSTDGTNSDIFSTDAAVGLYSRDYFGNTSFCFTQSDPAYQNCSNALSGNFSVTAWVKTTNSVSDDFANAYYGAPIFFAGADYNNHCTIPLSITGSKAAFTIVDSNNTVTLHSTSSVNDGNYHFLAVTRQQSTGLMSIYVDGALETTGIGITNPVVTQGYVSIAGGYNFYAGLLDDVRLYSTNLSAADVADIYTGGSGVTLAYAIGDTNLSVTTSGDANWFAESTNTDNGAPYAVQSGSVTNYQSSTLTTVVTGPGTLTFNWSNIANDPNQGFDCEFYIDDPNTNDIADLYSGVNAWQSIQYTVGHSITIPPGQHTLGWVVYANNDTDPTEAAYVDNLVFTPPATNPVSGNFSLGIIRQQDATLGDIYFAFPSFNSITPAATGSATNRLESPNNYFNLNSTSGGDSPSSAILYSLNSVLNECTNGLWSLYIDYGAPDQRQFQFSMSIAGLTTNQIPAVQLIMPTNGATGIPLNTAFEWLGPSNYSTLYVDKQYVDGSGYVGTSLPATDTNWPSPPMLVAGTNQFYISYSSNNFPNVSATLPVDSNDVQTATSWTAGLNLSSAATANFVVKASAVPFALKNSRNGGGNFQFTFQSQSGYTSTIYYRTNLQTGQWLVWTSFPGDGTVKTSTVPLTLFSPSRLGFIRVGTQ
jgi:hypothetical protein